MSSAKKMPKLEPITLGTLQRTARIIPGGAAYKALVKYTQLKAEGKNPSLWLDRKNQYFVVQHDGAEQEAI